MQNIVMNLNNVMSHLLLIIIILKLDYDIL